MRISPPPVICGAGEYWHAALQWWRMGPFPVLVSYQIGQVCVLRLRAHARLYVRCLSVRASLDAMRPGVRGSPGRVGMGRCNHGRNTAQRAGYLYYAYDAQFNLMCVCSYSESLPRRWKESREPTPGCFECTCTTTTTCGIDVH